MFFNFSRGKNKKTQKNSNFFNSFYCDVDLNLNEGKLEEKEFFKHRLTKRKSSAIIIGC